MSATLDPVPEKSAPVVQNVAEVPSVLPDSATVAREQEPAYDKAVFYDAREVYGC